MKTVELINIYIKNFRSFREESVLFPLQPGLRFMGGENIDEPQLGANGVGKSSFWQALRWCLYGDTNKTTYISNITTWGEEQTEVVVTLMVAGQKHIVNRSGPPVYIYLDGARVDQAAINNLLGLQRMAFQHSVLFSQEQRLFPDLSIPERGDLLEDVLGLSYWSKCIEVAAEMYSTINAKCILDEKHLANVDGQLKSLPSLVMLGKQSSDWEASQETKILNLNSEELRWTDEWQKQITMGEELSKQWKDKINYTIDDMVKQLDELEARLPSMKEDAVEVDHSDEVNTANTKYQESKRQLSIAQGELLKAELDIEKKNTQLVQLLTTPNCPYCGQTIVVEDRDRHIEETRLEMELAESKRDQLREVVHLHSDSTAQLEQILLNKKAIAATEKQRARNASILWQESGKEHSRLEASIRRSLQESNPYEEQIVQLKAQVNPYPQLIAEALAEVNPYKATVEKVKLQQAALALEQSALAATITSTKRRLGAIDYWKQQGLKRIRLYLTQKVLASLELDINSAISTLGMVGWNVRLSTETETKSGTVRLGIQIQVSSPKTLAPWESWSGGESQRLRIGMALGMSNMIQRARGSWWNIQVWDEQSLYLSDIGVEGMLQTLDYAASTSKRVVFVCDHTALTYSNFSEIWNVKRLPELGSKIEVGALCAST